MIWKTYFIKVVECNGTNSNQISNKKTGYTKKYHNIQKRKRKTVHFTQQSRMPCFFYVTNSVYMEQKPETGKSTDKMENACYTSTIKTNEKKLGRKQSW